MQVMARSSHAACHSFLTVRRVIRVAARRSTALRLMRVSCTQPMSSGIPGLRETSSTCFCFNFWSATTIYASIFYGTILCACLVVQHSKHLDKTSDQNTLENLCQTMNYYPNRVS